MRSTCGVAIAFLLVCSMALAEEVGLVLSGGGAKGAYEVGVWKAMKEAGVAEHVTVISGTSVGALNAALFASEPDMSKIEKIWLENLRGVLMPNATWKSNVIERIRRGDGDDSVLAKMDKIHRGTHNEGVVDPQALSNILAKCLRPEWTESAPVVYSTSCENGMVAKSYLLNAESHEKRIELLRASSAIPILFSTVNVDGKIHVDGACKMNTPIEPIVRNFPKIKTIYVVYLDEIERVRARAGDDRVDMEKYESKNIVEIFPSQSLHGRFGAILFNPKFAKWLFQLGYDDAKKVLCMKNLRELQQ